MLGAAKVVLEAIKVPQLVATMTYDDKELPGI